MDSILTSIKKLLGLTETYEVFDNDILIFINSQFSTLAQLGVKTAEGYKIMDETARWDDVLLNDPRLEFIKTYIFLNVKITFDPPASSTVLEAYNRQIKELEWRISVASSEQ